MPWIAVEDCNGCGLCVSECPADTILLNEDAADINMEGCIRCGVCHEICPQDAVKHDSEKVAEIIERNVEMTKINMERCAEYFGDEKERIKCLNRMKKHYNREKMIAEKTLEVIERLA